MSRTAAVASGASSSNDLEPAGLSGSMGSFRLGAMVIAFAAPLVAVAGWLSILIAFGGAGAPVLMLGAMALVMIFSVGFVAMGRHMANPGAFYSYISASLGRSMGLGAGFIAITTYVLLGLSNFTFVGIVASGFVVDTLHGPEVTWYWYSLALLVFTTIFGYFNVELSAKVLLVAMALEVLIITVFDIAVFGGNQASSGGVSLEPFSSSAVTGGSWGIGLLFAILLFNGFEGTAAFREEIRDPARTIGRATFSVVAFIGVFYAFTLWALISYFGADDALTLATTDPAHMFTTALGESMGQWLVDVVSVLILTSGFAASISISSILSRYIYSLGVDRVLPRQLATVHPQHKSPYIAALAASVLYLVVELPFVLAGTDPAVFYGQLGGTGGYAYLLLFTVVSLAVIVYFWRQRKSHSVNVWVAFVAPAVSVVAMGSIFIVAIRNFTTLTGGSGALAIILQAIVWGSGLTGVVLALVFRAKRPDIFARIGRRNLAEVPSAAASQGPTGDPTQASYAGSQPQ